jgi:hypothetical protein
LLYVVQTCGVAGTWSTDPWRRPAVAYIGRAIAGQKGSTLGRKVEVTRIHRVPSSVALSELESRLPNRFSTVLRHLRGRFDGGLPKDGGQALLDLLVSLRPHLRGVVDKLRQIDERLSLPRGNPAGQLLLQQRDATGLALQLGGLDRGAINQTSDLRDQLNRDGGPNFVSAMEAGSRGIEDQFINHDLTLFHGLQEVRARDVAFRTFRGHGNAIVAGNVNRDDPEHVLGIDLLYYNVNSRSALLLQYKPMEQRSDGWWYRPDSDRAQLDKELCRMKKLDDVCAELHKSGGDYRLSPAPSWFKLFYRSPVLPSGDDLCPGIYLQREHFEYLRNSPKLTKGRRGAVRLGPKNVPRYSGTSAFTALIQDGWIGSTGTGSDHVVEQIEASLGGQRGVVFAALIAEEESQVERTAKRRQGRNP